MSAARGYLKPAMRRPNLAVRTHAHATSTVFDGKRAPAQDRFFAFADRSLVDEVVTAWHQGTFTPEPGSAAFHPGATRSFKQAQYTAVPQQHRGGIHFHMSEARRPNS